jgi:type II secretory pathway component PulK
MRRKTRKSKLEASRARRRPQSGSRFEFRLSRFRRAEHASALLLVMWAIFLLTGAILTWSMWIQNDMELAADRTHEVEARAMALSGLALGKHPLVSERTPGLEEELDSQRGFRVRIVGEGGKLNINWMLAGEDPRRIAIFKYWLSRHGLDFKQIEVLSDCLLDYTDGDNLKRLNGAEDEPGYMPANRPFQSLDEIERVMNIEPLLLSPGWRDELTIYSQGPIDLSSANEDILRMLPGMTEGRITRFLQIRRGRDGVDGTFDDFQFKNLQEIQSYLGFSAQQFKELSGLVVAKDQVQRIISEGRAGNVIRQLECVVRKGGSNPVILYWQE